MPIETSTINRIRRTTALIAANAKLASPGPWYQSHGHVIAPGRNKKGGSDFDVACQPWHDKHHTVYGHNPKDNGRDDMRHIATCEPKTMLRLVDDVKLLLNERDSLSALAQLIDQMVNNTMGGDDDPRAKALGEAAETYLTSEPTDWSRAI